jgi:pimeloyl-ACP methyl ester carboxylesterase
LVIAITVAIIGIGFVLCARRITGMITRRILLGVSWFVLVIGALLTLTSAYHAISVARMWARHPAPGQMIDVGGYEMHLLAEGENNGNPTLVWVPGGHSFGYNFYNFHKIFREETRSILFDRPATGWSDVGPYPRTTSLEVDEFHRMMQAGGETEPIVLIGHSYGGLFAVVYAMRYPEQMAGLILFDPGIAELYQNPQAAAFLNQYSRSTFVGTLLSSFGAPSYLLWSKETEEAVNEVMAHFERELADVWTEVGDLNRAAKNGYGSASIYSEINDPAFFDACLIKPGALDGTPFTCVTYLGGDDLDSREAIDTVLAIRPDLDEAGAREQLEGLKKNRQYIISLSDLTQTVSIPDGASHNFPYERPAFITDLVRDMLTGIAEAGNQEEIPDVPAPEPG